MLVKSLYQTYHSSKNGISTQGWEEQKGPQGPFLLDK